MFRFCFACIVSIAGGALAVYPDGSAGNDLGNQGIPNSYGYGYSGSFSGGVPQHIPIPYFDFSGFLGNYLNSMYKQHQEFLKNIQNQAQGGFGQPGGLNTRSGFGSSYSGSFGSGTGGGGGATFSGYPGPDAGGFIFPDPSTGGSFGPGYGGASASGSVGPGGIHQSASVFPENPNIPNVNTRFAGSGQPDGFHSVFTSSSSSTSNVDGKPRTVQHASTTVNDNGKITTYTAKNP